jgi:hypothetical protein
LLILVKGKRERKEQMPYRITWKLHAEYDPDQKEHSGPPLGYVEDFVFIPLTKAEVEKRVDYSNRNYRRGTTSYQETPITVKDLPAMKAVYSTFYAILGWAEFKELIEKPAPESIYLEDEPESVTD